MKEKKLAHLFDSFWTMPLLLGLFALIFAQIMIALDAFLIKNALEFVISRRISVEDARSILTVLAGSVLGVAATSFSITTSVLATASSTYGPRLVRNFMSDKRNQFILGSFGASFIYAIVVLRSIDTNNGGFIPSLSIDMGIFFGIVNVALLIYFIHHIADSIQISTLISRVRDDLIRSVRALYAEQPPETVLELEEKGVSDVKVTDNHGFSTTLPVTKKHIVTARNDGYISYVDLSSMVDQAQQKGQVIKLLIQPGDHVYRRQPILYVWFDNEIAEDQRSTATEWTHDHIKTSTTRSPRDDIRYAVQQPVDITIRALSPGINDPFTAINALQGLGAGLSRLVELHNMPAVLFDQDKVARIFKHTITIEHLLESTFRTLRSNVAGSVDATLEVLSLADTLLTVTEISSYRRIILRSVGSISDAFMESSAPGMDKQIIKNAADQVLKKYADTQE